MDNDSLRKALAVVWTEVARDTGVPLYPRGPGLEAQLLALRTFITNAQRFLALTADEMRYAFQLNLQGVYGEIIPHYNRELNAEYVGSILTAYCKLRRQLHETKSEVLHAIAGTDAKALLPSQQRAGECTPAEWRERIQIAYRTYCDGRGEFVFDCARMYLVCRRLGLIPTLDYTAWRQAVTKSILERQGSITKLKETDPTRTRLRNIYERFERTGKLHHEELILIVGAARKKMLFRFFQMNKDFEVVNLWETHEYRELESLPSYKLRQA